MLILRQEGYLFSIQSLTSGNEEESRLDICTKKQKIKDTYLAFQIVMFDHKLKVNKYKSGIISGLAVIGLDINKGRWVKAQNFTPVLLAIIIIVYALIAYQVYIIRQREIYRLWKQGLEAYKSNIRTLSMFKLVKKIVHQFITLIIYRRVPTPIDQVLYIRIYGFSIQYSTNGEGRVVWDSNKILIKKQMFILMDLQSMVKGLYKIV